MLFQNLFVSLQVKFSIMAEKESIIESLDAFIRKYYKNLLIKGILYSVGLLVSMFLIAVVLEHFGYFGTLVRGVIFWVYVAAMVVILGWFVVRPLLKMHKFGNRISYDDAAQIIGEHFPEVSDKLLNLLQLQRQSYNIDSDLLEASIRQKTSQLRPIPFLNAIDLKSNKKYLKYALPPLVLVVAFLIISPSLVTEPSKRIINYSTYYEKPAPFHFVIENDSLEALQQEDYELKVAITGESMPNEVFIDVEGNIYKMKAIDKLHYSYVFKNLQKSRKFALSAADVTSETYELVVHPKPAILNFQVVVNYPSYIGRENETFSNEGDLTLPEGSVVKWIFQLKDVDTLYFGDNSILPDANGRASYSMRVMSPMSYMFYGVNHYTRIIDTLGYNISVIEDGVPMIAVVEMEDSLDRDRLFFHGRIKDDYGFTRLEFRVVRSNKSEGSPKDTSITKIGITKETSQEFYFSVNTEEWNLMPGDEVLYYFEVWDNDGIHGAKSSKSQQFKLEIPTEEELEQLLDKNTKKAYSSAEGSMSELKKLQEEINDIMRRLVDKKELNWQDKKELQELAKKQEQVKEMMQQMQQQINENNRLEQKYKEQNEKIIEKQRELDRLFNEVMSDEMKEMMKEIDKLLQESDKKKVQQELENLKINNEELEKQLDQNLELMKRLEMEKKVEDVIAKTEKLAEKQDKLAKETANSKPKDKAELLEKQEQLASEFQNIKKDIEGIKREYKEIDKDIDFKVDKSIEQSIEQHQTNSEQKINKGKNKEASEDQNKASEDMERLAQQMEEAQMEIEQSDLAEDAEMVRQLLKNLVQLSFNQEDLINRVNNTYIQDPKYQQIIVDQNKIKEDFRNVEDSLRTMAKRQIAVASSITNELSEINSNLIKSLQGLLDMNQSFYGNAKNPGSARSMQYSMTSFNNLALILAESLDKMQNQMRQNQQKSNKNCKNKGMKTKNSCSNPGTGKPSAKSMKQMQQELNKQMEALKKQLEKEGKNSQSGRKRIGEQGSVSEQFARMTAQQEMIRRMMQEYGQEMKSMDAGNSKLAKEIDEMMRQMEQTETDLVNKTITQQTIKRQQQIMTRLLQHEKAEMEREKEQRRESHEAQDIYQPTPSDLEKFQKLQEKNIDLFRVVPPTLSPYYRSKVDDYFFKQ